MMTSPYLVSAQWLNAHLNDDNLVIFDARLSPPGTSPAIDVKASYYDAHIQGAHFFDIEAICDTTSDLPHMLPSAMQFAQIMTTLGVKESDTFVCYDDGSFFSAPRAWFTLRHYGIKNVVVLDGGLAQWQKASYPLVAKVTKKAKSSPFNAGELNNVVTASRVLENIDSQQYQVLDARGAARFNAQVPEPRQGMLSGHIPHSINVPFNECVADEKFKSPEALRTLFSSKGVDIEKPIIVSCGSGVTASVLAFALAIIGAKEVKLYDGSWSEWGREDLGFPIEK